MNPATPTRLPGGLTAPSPEIIDEFQRGRVVDSMVATAAEYGYGGVTVERVLRHAHMSARTFHALFEGLEDWARAAYGILAARLQADLVAAWRAESEWPAAVRAAIAGALAFAEREPLSARFLAVEILAAGPAGCALQADSIDRLAARLREGREHCPAATEPNRFAERVLIAGCVSLIGDRLLAGEPLAPHEPELVELLLAPRLGLAEAGRSARA